MAMATEDEVHHIVDVLSSKLAELNLLMVTYYYYCNDNNLLMIFFEIDSAWKKRVLRKFKN